ncbi:MAG: type II toxin-antitoxin system PemK/MazF family toxin [Candidatus Omnitrophica bacterium]|nr:type II toxin-antitoxin system PemK/MazF family toxin [Candidatus Omnitrophota bacterium]
MRNAVPVAQITTTVRNIPVEIPLNKKDGLPELCVADLDTITTIRKSILTERICALKAEKMHAVDKAIKFALALD